MTNYIIPQILRYQNIDDLLKNNNRDRSLFDTAEILSIDKLLQEDFVCIVGEPGIGKSRLIVELKKHISTKLYHGTATKLELNTIPEDTEYCLIDALSRRKCVL